MDNSFIKKNKGILIWITGLPGSGKTTLAKELYNKVKNQAPFVLMDGDVFRQIMGNDLGYDVEDRIKNAYRIAKMNKYLTDHGINVICATVSLYKEIHQWNKENISNLIEVFIDVPMEKLIQRDQKNLYSKALNQQEAHCYGVTQNYDIPQNPNLIILNNKSLEELLGHSDKIIKLFKHNLD